MVVLELDFDRPLGFKRDEQFFRMIIEYTSWAIFVLAFVASYALLSRIFLTNSERVALGRIAGGSPRVKPKKRGKKVSKSRSRPTVPKLKLDDDQQNLDEGVENEDLTDADDFEQELTVDAQQ